MPTFCLKTNSKNTCQTNEPLITGKALWNLANCILRETETQAWIIKRLIKWVIRKIVAVTMSCHGMPPATSPLLTTITTQHNLRVLPRGTSRVPTSFVKILKHTCTQWAPKAHVSNNRTAQIKQPLIYHLWEGFKPGPFTDFWNIRSDCLCNPYTYMYYYRLSPILLFARHKYPPDCLRTSNSKNKINCKIIPRSTNVNILKHKPCLCLLTTSRFAEW